MSAPAAQPPNLTDATRSWVRNDQTQPLPTTPQSTSPEGAQKPGAPPEQPRQQAATVGDAWRSIKADDFLSVHQSPCSRQGFLAGIGGGATVGFLRFVLGAPVPRAANWAVGVGAAAAIAQYEFCQYGRRREREKMKRVVEVYDRKQAETRRAEEEAKRKREVREEEEARLKAQRRWYKFW